MAQEAHVRVRAPPHPALARSLGVDWATRRRPTPVTEVFVTPFTGGEHPPVSATWLFCRAMDILYQCKVVLKIQKFRRMVSYAGFYCFTTLVTYAYTTNTTRAGISRADQYYASYPAGTELLTDTAKLCKAALGSCFEIDDWGPIEFSSMAKHFDRQGKPPYAYHAARTCTLAYIPFTDSSRTPCLLPINSDFQYLAHLLSHGQLDRSG